MSGEARAASSAPRVARRGALPPAPPPSARQDLPRLLPALAVVAVWVGLFAVFRGRDTLSLGAAELTDLHRALNGLADAIGAGRDGLLFDLLVEPLRVAISAVVELLRALVAQPAFGRPVPVVGWIGVAALGSWLALALGGPRAGLVTAAGSLLLAAQGLWTETMDTLALTATAVLAALVIGIPLGVWTGSSSRVARVVTPVLDLMQTMPTLVYLAPLTLLFLIGPAAATIATLVYATPPVVRLTALGVRGVPAEALEAAASLGAGRLQVLRTVTLPLARRSIVLGVNQTTMAALSMVTVAALIDAPGLGKTVVKALQTLDVGTAFNAGLALVVLAVVLDRTTTAAATGAERRRRAGPAARRRRTVVLAVTGVLSLVAAWLSRTYVWAAVPPPEMQVGAQIAAAATAVVGAVQASLSDLMEGLKDGVTTGLIDPLEALLTQSPWWLVVAALVALAAVLAGARAAATAAVCLALLLGSGVWSDAMSTLAATLVATAAVVVLGLVVGVWLGRSPAADRWLRPLLDAGQTMPPFVYLVPFLALFSASRFTAVAAAVVYAAPVAIKVVADGVRAVPVAAVESALAVGSTRWQVVRTVQLPLSRRSLALATNQGLIHVLAMVVVGGLVGAGALGYQVVAGFSQSGLYGKGLAAGAAIVLLGVLLDRVTQAAAARTGRRYAPTETRPRRRLARGLQDAAARRPRRRGSSRAAAHPAPASGSTRPHAPARDGAGRRPGRLRGRDHRVERGRAAFGRLRDSVRSRLRHRRPRGLPVGRLRGQRGGDRGDR